MIAGFDELILRCADDDAKTHIREAIRCYESGAYRAAIVSAYVAVCFDLIAKLRSLSAGGDGQAKTLITDLENAQKQHTNNDPKGIIKLLSFERSLIDEFRDKFDFFGKQEFDELDRLREDRNKCAHPTFFNDAIPYAPSAELARLHIRSSLIYVLAQPPKQGKAALEGLRSVVLSAYFPDKVDDAAERLRSSDLGSAREALIKAFIDDIAFGWPDKTHPYFKKSAALIAIRACVEIHRAVAIPRAALAIDKLAKSPEREAVEFAGLLSLAFSEAAELVDNATKVTLRTWAQKYTDDTRGSIVKAGLKITWMRDTAISILSDLTPLQIGKIKDAPRPIVRRAAEIYASASNWNQANYIAEDCIIPLANQLLEEDIDLIFDNASSGKADLRGSHSFHDFIKTLYKENPLGKVGVDAILDKYSLEEFKSE